MNGVIIYNRGSRCAVRMLVMLDTLREWWDGPVTLFSEPPSFNELKAVVKPYNVDVVDVPEVAAVGSLIRRIDTAMTSPYDRSLYLDTDIVVVGKLDEMFAMLDTYEFVTTRFSTWMSTGKVIGGRISCMEGLVDPALLVEARKPHQAVNGGCWSFRKGTRFLQTWRDLAVKGDGKFFIPDEVALQVLYPSHPEVGLGDMKFNVSVKFGENVEDKRVVHFHGKKHVFDLPLCDLWKKRFHSMLDADKNGMKSIVQYADRRLGYYLAGGKDPAKAPRKGRKDRRAPRQKTPEELESINEPAIIPAEAPAAAPVVAKAPEPAPVVELKQAEFAFAPSPAPVAPPTTTPAKSGGYTPRSFVTPVAP